MKKIIFIAVILFTSSFYAQEKEGKEKVRAYKIAYLTEKLDLSSKEAEKFWPVYNTYNKNRRDTYKAEKNKIKTEIKEKGGAENFSNQEAEKILARIAQSRASQHQSKLNFRQELKKVLSAKKVLMFELAESEFNKKMMKRLKEQKNCN